MLYKLALERNTCGMIYAPRFAKLVEDAKHQITETTVEKVAAQLAAAAPTEPGFLLLDVREDHEWAKGCLPGAHHLGRGILERDIEALAAEPTTAIVLYCGGGGRSALAALCP